VSAATVASARRRARGFASGFVLSGNSGCATGIGSTALSVRKDRERTALLFFSGTLGGVVVVVAGFTDVYMPENTSGRIRSTATNAAIEHNVRTKKNFTPILRELIRFQTDSRTEALNLWSMSPISNVLRCPFVIRVFRVTLA